MSAGDIRALAAQIGGAGDRTRRQASQVVRRTGLALQNQARANAPVDTGFMRSSIGHTSRGNDVLSVEVTPTAHYAHFVEHGTIHMSAQPFMMPAADAVEPSFISAMEQIGGDIL